MPSPNLDQSRLVGESAAPATTRSWRLTQVVAAIASRDSDKLRGTILKEVTGGGRGVSTCSTPAGMR
jgi:hypothetical protein